MRNKKGYTNPCLIRIRILIPRPWIRWSDPDRNLFVDRKAQTPTSGLCRLLIRDHRAMLGSITLMSADNGRQSCAPAGESPVVIVARFNHVAIPQPGLSNQPGPAWRIRPSCPAGNRHGGCNPGAKQVRKSEHQRMTAVPKIKALSKLHCREHPVSQAHLALVGEADASWGETSECTRREPRDRGPDERSRNTGNNVGKDHLPAGIGDNLRRRGGIGRTEAAARVLVRRMGSYERASGGNALRGGRSATTVRATPVAVRRSPGTWWSRCLERVPDADPARPVSRAAWRGCCQSRTWRGVCEPTLEPPRCGAGQRRKARPPNRTRENRPSGMTTEAPGNVTHGGTVNPPGNRKGRSGNPPPTGARARALSRPPAHSF